MFKVRDKNTGITYWQCKNRCVFRHPVWEEKRTENEQKFLKELYE